jgi:hypothetical protein
MANTKPIGVAYEDQQIDGVPFGKSGGTVSFYGGTPVTQPAALTAQLTAITIADAAGTPDYAIQAVINTNAYGFASAPEAITFLYVVQNLQARLAQVEARLEALNLIAAN